MEFKSSLFKTTVAFATITLASFFIPNMAFAEIVKHLTVVNNSDLTLKPTAEGFAQGCVGGSIPTYVDPVEPHTTRVIDIIFLQYTASCLFNLLPQPNMMTYEQACHNVQAEDTTVFTGSDRSTLRCAVQE